MTLTRRTFLRAAGVSLALPCSTPSRRRRAARPQAAAPHGLHLHAAGAAPAVLLPGEGRARTTSSRRTSKSSRTSATTSRSSPGCRTRTSAPSHDSHLQLPDRRPAPGAAGRLPQHASRSTSSRPSTSAARRASPAWRCRARASACPGPAAARWCRRTPRRRSVFARLFLEGRPDEVQAQVRRLRDGQSILDAVRDQAQDDAAGARRRRPRQARRVLHQRPRAGAAAGPGRGVVEEAQAEGRRQAAAEHHQPGRPHRQDPAAGSTSSTWPCRPIRPGSSRCMLLGTSRVPPIPGVTLGHHDLSHHGQDPAKIAQLKTRRAGEDEDPARLPRRS